MQRHNTRLTVSTDRSPRLIFRSDGKRDSRNWDECVGVWE